MIKGKKVVAVIPVRGGSKGIPRKNLYRLGNDSLLERAIKIAKLCKYIDQVIVTTDDDEMYEVSQKYKVAATEMRPKLLATDDASTIDVVLDLLQRQSIDDSWILLLQVTSPLRTLDDLNAFFYAFESSDKEVEAIVSVAEFQSPHPDKIQKLEDGYIKSYLGKESMVARHLLPKVYELNGAFYLTHQNTIQVKKTFLPNKTIPFTMPKEKSINLDTIEDIYLMEMLIEKDICFIEEYEL
jgi:CMP-N,N'-diacetyllegionaminic acid synthase